MPKRIKDDLRWVWLREFVAVAEKRSFSRAARQLGTTQPNVTRHVKALQEWVGKVLVTNDRPVELTPDGEAFVHVAKQVIATLESSRATIPSAEPVERRKVSPKDIVIDQKNTPGKAERLPG